MWRAVESQEKAQAGGDTAMMHRQEPSEGTPVQHSPPIIKNAEQCAQRLKIGIR